MSESVVEKTDCAAEHSEECSDQSYGEDSPRFPEKECNALPGQIDDENFSLDTEGFFTHIGPAIEQLTQYHAEEIIGQECTRFIHPDDLPGLKASLAKTLSGISEPCEFRVFAKDGSMHQVHTSNRPLWKNGQVTGLAGSMTKVTDFKQAKDALKKSEGMFRALFESMNDAILFIDENRIFDCNNRALELWGCKSKKQLLGKSLLQLSPQQQPDGRDSGEAVLEKIKTVFSGQPESFEWQHIRIDGSPFDTEVSLRTFEFTDRQLIQAIIRDITDRRQNAEARREGRQRLYSIIQSLPSPAFVIDRDHTTLYWNKALEKLTGIRSLEVLGTSDHWKAFYKAKTPCLADLMVDEAFDRIPECYAEKCSKSELLREAYEVTDFFPQLQEGGKWLHLTCSILRDTKGHIIGAIEILDDIAERKQTNDALKAAEEKYQNLFDRTANGIYQITPEGSYTEINSAFARMFGYSSPDEAKKSLTNIIPQLCYDPDCAETNATGLNKRNSEDFAIQVRRKDGSCSSILNSVRAIRGEEGHVIRFEGITQDVTEQKIMEKALYKSEQEKSTVLDALSELVVMLDKDLRVVWSNRALNRYFKLKPGELDGKHCYESLHKLKRPCQICPALKVIESGRPQIIENFSAHGKRWILKAYPLRDDQGNLDGVVKIITDMTEQRQTKEELTHALELLRNTLEGTIQAMSVAVETRDPYTAGHQKRVADLARAIALEMGLSRKQIDGIRMAAVIHDIGKICVPAEILTKPTGLTEIEFDLIKVHSQAGYEILKDIEFPWPIARVILEHHEKIDGSGYPNGLMGANILMESRVLTVADVVEAINSHRPYRPALGIETALAEISRNKGKYYDPDVVDACMKLFTEKSFELKPN